MQKRILLYKNGVTAPEIRADVGTYDRWFSRVLNRRRERASLHVHRAFEDPRPDHRGFDAVILTGSPASLVEPLPWMDEACRFVRDIADAGLPVLGVCFGHQLIGYAWGGRVRQNPRGWETGTHEVELTDEGRRDPLFDGLPHRLRVNQSHRDEVEFVGPDVVRLAGGAHTEHQSVAIGGNVRGVQFHPEMDGVVIRRIIQHRRLILDEDAARTGREHHRSEVLLARSGDTPDAEKVVENFFERFVSLG